MAKISRITRSSRDGRFISVNIAARERTVPQSSADYVLSGGRGEAAYKLTKIIEGSGKSFSYRSGKIGGITPPKTAS